MTRDGEFHLEHATPVGYHPAAEIRPEYAAIDGRAFVRAADEKSDHGPRSVVGGVSLGKDFYENLTLLKIVENVNLPVGGLCKPGKYSE